MFMLRGLAFIAALDVLGKNKQIFDKHRIPKRTEERRAILDVWQGSTITHT